MSQNRVILIFSVLFFIIVSFFLYWHAPGEYVHFATDSLRYHFMAQRFSFKELPLEVLGYPFFLKIFYHLFGCSLGVIVGVQVLLSVMTLFLLRKIVCALHGETAQTLVTLWWVGNLGFFIYSQLFLIEIVLALLYVWFVERCIAFYEKSSLFTIAQAGLILSLSVLFRPAALFYAFCFTPFLLFISKKTLLYRMKAAVLFIVVFYMPLLLYMMTNYLIFKNFTLCPVMNVNLFLFFYPKLLFSFQQKGITSTPLMNAIDTDIAQNNITFKTQANLIKLILEYPFFAIKIWLFNMIKSCIGLYQAEWKLFFERCDQGVSFFNLPGSLLANMKHYIAQGTHQYWLYALGWYEVSYLMVEYIFAAIGSCWLLCQKKIWLFFFALSFIVYLVLITGPDGSGRFRMMIEPWLLVLASFGIAFIFGIKVKNKKYCD